LDTISRDEAVERVGEALFGTDWIRQLSDHANPRDYQTPLLPRGQDVMPAEVGIPFEQWTNDLVWAMRMAAQREVVKEWLEQRSFTGEQFSRAAFASTFAEAFPAAEPVKPKLPLAKVKEEIAAIATLAPLLRHNPNLKFAEALGLCRESYALSERGFRARIWPKAREAAGLPQIAPPGRKPKSSR
jgi:hypothetical protein